METKNKLLSIGVIITLIAAMSGTYYLSQDDDAYYCEAKDIVMICEKLSSGIGTRCYFEDTYKICSEGWVKLELEQQLEEIKENIKSKKIICNQEKCTEILQDG